MEKEYRYANLSTRLISNLVDCLMLIFLMIPYSFIVNLILFNGQSPGDELSLIMKNISETEIDLIKTQGYFNTILANKTIQNFIAEGKAPLVIIQFIFQIVLISLYILISWLNWGTTIGKKVFSIKICNQKDMGPASKLQLIVRFFSYIISAMPFFLGILFIGVNKRKRALHDYISGTVVIHEDK